MNEEQEESKWPRVDQPYFFLIQRRYCTRDQKSKKKVVFHIDIILLKHIFQNSKVSVSTKYYGVRKAALESNKITGIFV